MREISSSRSELTLTDWENGSLDLGAEHKMQHISELQLLHVTREIQVRPVPDILAYHPVPLGFLARGTDYMASLSLC